MQVYFSHSYRDIAINSYFLEYFVEEEIPLRADQKTDIWCIAKLERYLSETTGFVSIIPRRKTEQDDGAYSPYIVQELNLARRAHVPRLLFVDEQVLKCHRLDFPVDAVPFKPDAPGEDAGRHLEAIRSFRGTLERATRPFRSSPPKGATLVVSRGRALQAAAQDVAELLRRENYAVAQLTPDLQARALDDIRLLETLWGSELCVFILGERLSNAHLALAMAHTYSVPSVRLQYDREATKCEPSITGWIRWHAANDMLLEFGRQLASYKEGLVAPLEIARAAGTVAAVQSVGTMKWKSREDNQWTVTDGPGLILHVLPEYAFVQDEVSRVQAELKRSLGRDRSRETSLAVCRLLYDGIRRHRFGYEIEPQTREVGVQVIRTPSQIETHGTATCLDLACFFASLLYAASQNPLVVVLEGPGFAHALAGYRALDEPALVRPEIGDLRRAIGLGDAVFFEATGAAEAEAPVGAELPQERRDKLLDFMDAKAAAARMLDRQDLKIRCFLDARSAHNR